VFLGQAHTTEPVVEAVSVGDYFASQPSKKAIASFIEHLRKTGKPHTWVGLTTTKPPEDEVPVILCRFAIPTQFRRGLQTRAPCAICSSLHPKFDEGFLIWSPTDGFIRIIGRTCGHDFYTDGSYGTALAEFEAAEQEAIARAYLSEHFHELPRLLLHGWDLRLRLREGLACRSELTAVLTNKCVQAMHRCAQGGWLTISRDTGRRDERGNRIVETVRVSRVSGISAFSTRFRIEELERCLMAAGQWVCTVKDECADYLSRLSRGEAIGAETDLRAVVAALEEAGEIARSLHELFAFENLMRLTTWGRDRDCPFPFWIARDKSGVVYARRGIKPQTFGGCRPLRIPSSVGD